jgi:hypothetical protein
MNQHSNIRDLCVEHNIKYTDTNEPSNPVILDGKDFGDDFENLASRKADDPWTWEETEGICPKTKRAVTFQQTFIRTTKSDQQLLQEYK